MRDLVFDTLFRAYETTRIRVRLDPETARRRLAERCETGWPALLKDCLPSFSADFHGFRLKETQGDRLVLMPRLGGRNSLRPVIYVLFRAGERADECVVEAEFRPPNMRWFLYIWFGGVLLLPCAMLLAKAPLLKKLFFVGHCSLMMLGGWLVMWVSRIFGAREARTSREALEELLCQIEVEKPDGLN